MPDFRRVQKKRQHGTWCMVWFEVNKVFRIWREIGRMKLNWWEVALCVFPKRRDTQNGSKLLVYDVTNYAFIEWHDWFSIINHHKRLVFRYVWTKRVFFLVSAYKNGFQKTSTSLFCQVAVEVFISTHCRVLYMSCFGDYDDYVSYIIYKW